MFEAAELLVIRRAFARQITFLSGVENAALEEAFACVPREAFLGPGPWRIARWPTGYMTTPDADPAWLCSDAVVAILPERGLNNGQPSAHATWIAAAAPRAGDHIVHIGAGVGYYSAIMGHVSGSGGSVTAIEVDPWLAARAAANLAFLPNTSVLNGDGLSTKFAAADVIYVNAGASRPADLWLDALKDGGRLILPLTTHANFASRDPSRATGAVFRITRRGDEFDADYISRAVIIPGEGMRDEVADRALCEAFARGGFETVKRLRRTEAADRAAWIRVPGWSLTYD